MVCSAHQITKNEGAVLKPTVLFTKNPSAFSNNLMCSPKTCQVVTELCELPELVSHLVPKLILIDTTTVSYHQPQLSSCLDSCLDNRPTIVYAPAETVIQILCQPNGQERPSPKEIPKQLNKALDTALLSFSFSPALKGYSYIKQACYYQYLNTMEISAVKKDIYESVSDCYRTTVYSVERGISFAIQKAYCKNKAPFHTLFHRCKKPPSNMTFLKTFFIYLEQEGYL